MACALTLNVRSSGYVSYFQTHRRVTSAARDLGTSILLFPLAKSKDGKDPNNVCSPLDKSVLMHCTGAFA